jgi:O-methyltransferase
VQGSGHFEAGAVVTKHARPPDADAVARELYLGLLKRALTFMLWNGRDGPTLDTPLTRPVQALVNVVRRVVGMVKPPDPSVRERGRDWPAMGLTMIGTKRLDNVQQCVEDVLRHNVPGDLIEAGVWRGGVPILMRAVLRVYGVTDRIVWVADSFEGLPAPNVRDYPADRGFDLTMFKSLAVSIDEVRANFLRFGLLDRQVEFLKGWFKNTLPGAPITRLAVMRLDADLYESTLDALVHLYPKLSPGGYAIIDDYGNAPPCRRAVDEYRERFGITEKIVTIDWSGVYWQKARS